MYNSIWSTVECSSWSRNFDYNNYVSIAKASGCVHKLLLEDEYNRFCDLFQDIMLRDYEEQSRDSSDGRARVS